MKTANKIHGCLIAKIKGYANIIDSKDAIVGKTWTYTEGTTGVHVSLDFRKNNILVSQKMGITTTGFWEYKSNWNVLIIKIGDDNMLFNQILEFGDIALALRLPGVDEFFLLVNEKKVYPENVYSFIMDFFGFET